MECCGPIGNLWEGGYDAMTRIQLPLVADEPTKNESKLKEKGYKKYDSTTTYMQDYAKRLPLSVLAFSNRQWGLLIFTENKIQKVEFGDYKGCINGMHYWSINVVENDTWHVLSIEEIDSIRHCILLPKLMENGWPRKTDDPIFAL
jgi:hypothetical protein